MLFLASMGETELTHDIFFEIEFFTQIYINCFASSKVEQTSDCRFMSLSYYRHLAASPSFGGQVAGLQMMEMLLDGDKYDRLLNLQTLRLLKSKTL